MRILVVGTGGVGSALAASVHGRSFFEHCAPANYDPVRPEEVAAGLDDGRFSAHRIDASSKEDVVGWSGTLWLRATKESISTPIIRRLFVRAARRIAPWPS